MDLLIVLISVWIQVGCVPGIQHEDGAGAYLPAKDVLLLKDEEDPKCFSRTQHDFTCFFETQDDGIYDFSYKIEDEPEEKSCSLSVQRTEEETFLHICTFPDNDVFLYILTHLKVVESSTNTTLFTRSVSVEDQLLLDAPVDVSLHHTDQAGELQATWRIQTEWETKVVYKIRYSSRRLGERTKEGEKKDISRLVSLVPGELLLFQIRVKHHIGKIWSHWTDSVREMVPQSADDISLSCYTSDLRNVTCEWNENTYGGFTYKLFYKSSLSRATDWTECVSDGNLTGLCRFHGDESRAVQVKLSNGSTPFSRTFYSQPFSLSSSIKTSPPGHLTGKLKRGRLCLTWDAPLLPLSAHLQYQVSYQPRQDADWTTVFLKGLEAATCLEVPAGCRYRAQVRAKPNGAGYSGHWSDWSQELTGDIPTDTSAFLILCIPVLLLIVTIVFISMYFSKLKRYFWPPVPNLDKVLQGFLTEINRKTLDPIFTAKQFYDETPASVVVVVKSEDEASGPGSPLVESDRLLSAAQGSSGGEQVDGSPEEVSPDYVTLSTDNAARCPRGNEYVYEQAGECGGLGLTGRVDQTTCHCSYTGKSFSVPSCTGSDHLNRSYLPLAESVDKLHCQVAATRGPGNLYLNF